ncbi:hypothetical protein Ddye_016364 [Dipteronia dyeriana]|uniref:Endonuclease/exonuclease/phosphatase domain-containing protein n=1 Tax=Dipteronia dyeriana TaxID=168575 RepID=A0AAD9U6M3_9ROSI|nr:hypothetical protein Ddye_016364 [Dipteronia dyeriana]
MIGGDFNSVLHQSERIGSSCIMRSMTNFNNFMNSAKVVDIPLYGMSYTWTHNRELGAWARLDWFLCDPLFLSWFSGLIQKGLCKSLSDHNPVMLSISNIDCGPKPFRIHNGWVDNKELMSGVIDIWKKSKGSGSVSFRRRKQLKNSSRLGLGEGN